MDAEQFDLKKAHALVKVIAHRLGGVGKTRLMKIIYLVDFIHFERTGKTLTGSTYRRWQRGPVPLQIFEEHGRFNSPINALWKLRGKTELYTSDSENLDSFCESELGAIDHVITEYGNKPTSVLIEISHNEVPWQTTDHNQDIPLYLAPLREKSHRADPKTLEEIKSNRAYIEHVKRHFPNSNTGG